MANKNLPPKEGPKMATVPARQQKSAEDELLDSFGKMIDEAAEKLSPEEFQKRADRTNEILDRAIAEHSRRRGTA
jgi:hypothetical protein